MTSTLPSPVQSRAKTTPPRSDVGGGDVAAAAAVLGRHAENPSAFLSLNDQTLRFTTPGVDGLVAYRPAGRSTLVQLGGVYGAPAEQPALLEAFLAFAREQRRRVVGVQLMRADAETYASYGFAVNQFGADYARGLADFSLRGKKHMQLRNKVSRARRAGVSVVEVPADAAADGVVGGVVDGGLAAQLDDIDLAWLRSKGRHVKELQFMVGQRGGAGQEMRRLFVARDEGGNALGYISFSPVYGAQSGWLHDLSRRRPDAPPGVLELIVVSAVEVFRAEGARFLHFGLTPFTSLSPEHEVPGSSRLAGRILRLLAERGSAVYPAADQLAYKAKWGLDLVQPEYIAFQGGISLRAVWNLVRLTNAA